MNIRVPVDSSAGGKYSIRLAESGSDFAVVGVELNEVAELDIASDAYWEAQIE